MSTGLIYMLASTFVFSLVNLSVKYLTTHHGFESPELVFFRTALSLVFLAPILYQAGVSFLGNNKFYLLLRGALGFIGLAIFFYNLQHLQLFEASVLVYTNPVFAALFAPLYLGESNSVQQWLLTVVSLLGVVLIVTPREAGFAVWTNLFQGGATWEELFPYALGLLGACAAALAYLTVRKASEFDHTLTIVWYFPMVSLLPSLPNEIVPGFDYQFVMPEGWLQWLPILVIGGGAVLGQIFLTRGLSLESGARATAMNYVTLVWNAMWGFLFFSEIPAWWTVLGAAIITACVIGISRLDEGGHESYANHVEKSLMDLFD